MIKTQKITYKVFLFERVKKKVKLFDTETYPLQIRLTAGTRTVYLKSYFFGIMQQNRYLQEVLYNNRKISMEDIIVCEEELMQYILTKDESIQALEPLRQSYSFLSRDILQELDNRFKSFLVDFFYTEKLPAYSIFIQNDGDNHTSEFILQNLEKSLQPSVYIKLLESAAKKAPPYIPFISFFREKIKTALPVLPVYRWQQENITTAFNQFIEKRFPEYSNPHPADYANKLLGDLV